MTPRRRPVESEELLSPREVAAMFGVSPSVVVRWATSGKLASVRTLGGHHRFRAEEVRALRDQMTTDVGPA